MAVRLHLCNTLTSCHLQPAPVSGTFFSRQLKDQGTWSAQSVTFLPHYSTSQQLEGRQKTEHEYANGCHVVWASACTTSTSIDF